jgi:hypothetical protein
MKKWELEEAIRTEIAACSLNFVFNNGELSKLLEKKGFQMHII